jgi:hypothetical protein
MGPLDFIERIFGISPDNGTGWFELSLVLLLVLLFVLIRFSGAWSLGEIFRTSKEKMISVSPWKLMVLFSKDAGLTRIGTDIEPHYMMLALPTNKFCPLSCSFES